MWVVAIVIAVVVGAVAGAALVAARARRSSGAPSAAPVVEPEPEAVDARSRIGGLLCDAVDHLDLGMVVVDQTNRVVYRNPSADALRGTHAGVIIDGHVDDALRAARGGAAVERIVELHGPPRQALKLVAEPTSSGGAVATIEDVSERVRIETMRTDFVANISHELKTPVGAIAVLAEAMVDEDDPDVIRRVSDRLVSEAHRAATTIDDLLELSRIESARVEREAVDLRELVHAALARGRAADDGKGIELSTFELTEPLMVRVDRRQVESALGNLVENAVKYSDRGTAVQVRIRVDERSVEVLVADQGHGIPARDLDRIFERFYRVDRARSRTTGGTGLGLSIVRHVAHNHGGEVLVSSQEGEGSTFAFRLPASVRIADETGSDVPRPDPTHSDVAPAEPSAARAHDQENIT